MPSGFKGTNVRVESLELSSPNGITNIVAGVQFVDDEGVVHAFVKHVFPIEEGDPLFETLKELHKQLIKRISALHFRELDSAVPNEKVTHGIREALRDPATEDHIRPG